MLDRHLFLPASALCLLALQGHAQTPICTIQGTGPSTSYAGQTVTVEGFVTALYTGSGSVNGYFLEQPDCDGNANTSNGIFVYDPTPGGVAVGQEVQVVGIVSEYEGVTEITASSASVIGSGVVTPTVVELPLSSYAAWERYEGMLLRFPATLVVADNQDWVEYGQLVLSPQRMLTPTQQIDPNDAVASGTNTTGAGNVAAIDAAYALLDRDHVILDDGRTSTFPSPLPWVGANGTLRTGSTIADLRGVLHYSYDNYRIHPVGTVPVVHAARPAVPTVGGSIRAASLNVLNYWTTIGGWGAQTSGELARQRAKLLAAIQALDADVLALNELENNDVAWAELLAALNTAVGAGTYAAREENAFGSGGTKSVIFYKAASLTPVGALDALSGSPFQRPHLTQAFIVNATGGQFLFSTAHLRSKLCDNATGGDTDQEDGQGCYNANRRQQSVALAAHWSQLRNSTGINAQLIMGDFNSYGEEDPLDVLRAAGLQQLVADDAHSYAYRGLFGALDHAWATADMVESTSGASVWNINSDEPEALDYRDENLSRYQPNAFRCSDHDPLLVGIDAAGLPTGLVDRIASTGVQQRLINGIAQWSLPDQVFMDLGLYDALGQLVWNTSGRGGTFSYDMTGLRAGLYVWYAKARMAETAPVSVSIGRFVLP